MARRNIGPVPYDVFRQRVRRYRRTDVLLAVAALNANLEQAKLDQGLPPGLPDAVKPFSLAGIARAALIAGNDHRNSPIELRDLVRLCADYINIDEPAIGQGPRSDRLRAVMNHVAYEQFGYQYSPMENIGRTLVLLADQAGRCSDAPSPDDWVAALGVSLETFLRLGFAMHVAALRNGGSIDRQVLEMNHVAPIFAPLTPTDALTVIDRWFVATPEELRVAGAAEEIPTLEKWSLSPLVARPIVGLPDGRYVVPWPRLVLDRITPTGLYFIGLDEFGPTFPDSLGCMFERYVGDHLNLLEHAEIRPEIVYGKSSERTVDYFVITPEVVLLVEVKAARPIRATRLGESPGDEDTAKKVGYAYAQIARTAQLLQQRHPALAQIPADRPLCGLVVTLEPFHLVNTFFYDDVFQRPAIPTTVASAHELEGTVAVLRTARDVGSRLRDAFMSASMEPIRLTKAADGLLVAPNPLLDEAWGRFTHPWSA